MNSGSSANLLTIAALKTKFPNGGEVIVPPLTWVSDISSVIFFGFKPVFVEMILKHFHLIIMDVTSKVNSKTGGCIYNAHKEVMVWVKEN